MLEGEQDLKGLGFRQTGLKFYEYLQPADRMRSPPKTSSSLTVRKRVEIQALTYYQAMVLI